MARNQCDRCRRKRCGRTYCCLWSAEWRDSSLCIRCVGDLQWELWRHEQRERESKRFAVNHMWNLEDGAYA